MLSLINGIDHVIQKAGRISGTDNSLRGNDRTIA